MRFAALALAVLGGCGRVDFASLDDARTMAVDVPDAFNACAIRSIAVGERHVCVLRQDRVVYCSGDNAQGQLGIGGITAPSAALVRSDALSAGEGVAIAAGREFTCITDGAGALRCLGDNKDRQLDLGINADQVFTLVTESVPPAASMALGNAFGCALTQDGRVFCFGDSDEGEGGVGTSPDQHMSEEVASLTDDAPSAISAGTLHLCALLSGGRVACWGDGGLGRLGVAPADTCTMATAGSIACETTPAILGITDAVGVAAGHEHTCIRTSGDGVRCWGNNDQAQCGAPASTQVGPTTIANLSASDAVVAGRHHTCALMRGSGVVACWGSSTQYELGSDVPDQPSAIVVPLARPARAIASHPMARMTCAILDDGTASCWGANDFGQLGRGTITARELPGPFEVPCN